MPQVKNSDPPTFKIKSIRKSDESERIPPGSACSVEAGDKTDKPTC